MVCRGTFWRRTRLYWRVSERELRWVLREEFLEKDVLRRDFSANFLQDFLEKEVISPPSASWKLEKTIAPPARFAPPQRQMHPDPRAVLARMVLCEEKQRWNRYSIRGQTLCLTACTRHGTTAFPRLKIRISPQVNGVAFSNVNDFLNPKIFSEFFYENITTDIKRRYRIFCKIPPNDTGNTASGDDAFFKGCANFVRGDVIVSR